MNSLCLSAVLAATVLTTAVAERADLDARARSAYEEIATLRELVDQGGGANYTQTWSTVRPRLERWLEEYQGKVDLKQHAWLMWWAMIVQRKDQMSWTVRQFERYLRDYGYNFPEEFTRQGKQATVIFSRYLLPTAYDEMIEQRDASRFQFYLQHYFGHPGVPYEDYQNLALQILRTEPEGGWDPLQMRQELVAAAKKAGHSQALLDGLAALSPSNTAGSPAVQGYMFHPFSGPDLDGNVIAVEDFKNKVLLVDFWATWCGPCLKDMPHLAAVYHKYRDEDFEILSVSGDHAGEIDKVRAVIAKNGMIWPQIYDNGLHEAQRLNGVQSIPYTVLLDRNGAPRYFNLRGEEQLSEKIEELLAETPEQAARNAARTGAVNLEGSGGRSAR